MYSLFENTLFAEKVIAADVNFEQANGSVPILPSVGREEFK
jgi:hypothetical protein